MDIFGHTHSLSVKQNYPNFDMRRWEHFMGAACTELPPLARWGRATFAWPQNANINKQKLASVECCLWGIATRRGEASRVGRHVIVGPAAHLNG